MQLTCCCRMCSKMQQQLEEAQHQAALISQQKQDLELQLAELQRTAQAIEDAPAADTSADQLIIQNLREELRAQEQDISEARRLKTHVG